MELRWHGHSFFSVLTASGTRLVVDPFFQATRKRPDDIKADLVLVTHAHGDHAGDAAKLGAPILSVHETAEELARRGASATGMGIGGFYRFRDVKIWCAPAHHSSSFDGDEGSPANGGDPCGFVVDDGTTRFYHAGDTGIFGDMRTVIRDLLQPHVAAVPIGDHYTMGVEHAARAVDWLGVRLALPMHYDTFPAIRADPKEFERFVALHAPQARVVVPPVDGGVEVRGPNIVRALSA